jgi:hypothetical protein
LHRFSGISWNSDGTELAVNDFRVQANAVTGQIVQQIDIINRSTGTLDNVLLGDSSFYPGTQIDWARNGVNKLAFYGYALPSDYLETPYTLDVSTSATPVSVTAAVTNQHKFVCWSPDNSLLCYVQGDSTSGSAPNWSGHGQINTINRTTNEVRLLYRNGTTFRWLDWRRAVPAQPELAVMSGFLDFGSISAGDSSTTLCVTVKNAGQVGGLTFKPAIVSGSADFWVTSSPIGSLGSGNSAQYCVRFSPHSSGRINGTLTIVSNGADSGIQYVNLTGTGLAPAITVSAANLFRRVHVRVGDSITRCILVSNTGAGRLVLKSIQIQGSFSSNYSVMHAPQSIPAGGMDSICIRYTSQSEFATPATLVIVSNSLANPTVTIDLLGAGILPRLTLTPNAIGFDSVQLGDTKCATVTLNNPGTDTVRIRSDYFSYADPDFSFTPLSPSDRVLAPGESKAVNICFAPLLYGTRMARLWFVTDIPKTIETNPRDTSGFDVEITGTGVPTGLLSMRSATDSVLIAKEACRIDTIVNTGSADYTITGAALSDSSEFTVSGIAFPTTLRPGARLTLQVCAKPNGRGLRAGFLNFTGTTDGFAKRSVIPLSVFGELACDAATPSALFSTSKVSVGSTDTARVTVTNCGDIATSYTAGFSTNASNYSIVGSATSLVVKPGDSVVFRLVFVPSTHGMLTDTLNITAPNVATQSVGLSGTGLAASLAGAGTAPPTNLNQTSPPFDVTLTNSGNVDWSSGIPSVTGPFQYAGSAGVTIAAGSTGTMQFTFSTTAAGTNTGTATFPSAIPSEHPQFTLALSGQGAASSVGDENSEPGISLDQNYPNPAQRSTTIVFHIPHDTYIQLTLRDILGRTVQQLVDGRLTAGNHEVLFDASAIADGMYYYELLSDGNRIVKVLSICK